MILKLLLFLNLKSNFRLFPNDVSMSLMIFKVKSKLSLDYKFINSLLLPSQCKVVCQFVVFPIENPDQLFARLLPT